MRILSEDGRRVVDIGSWDIWHAVYSTASSLGMTKITSAIKFMEKGKCLGIDGYETARQFNLMRDAFAAIPPEKVVYDIYDKKKKAPWDGKISPVITSCANLFTTADGKDLLYEVVSILAYGQITNNDIYIE